MVKSEEPKKKKKKKEIKYNPDKIDLDGGAKKKPKGFKTPRKRRYRALDPEYAKKFEKDDYDEKKEKEKKVAKIKGTYVD